MGLHHAAAQTNMITGLRYRNFSNPLGSLADGSCCDDPALTAPNCPPDQCDVSFTPCASYSGGGGTVTKCGAYHTDPTPTMVDNNSFALNQVIGNVRGKPVLNMKVFLSEFSPLDIQFTIVAEDVTRSGRALIAEFSFVVDWLDSSFSQTDHWRPLLLRDAGAELGVDVVRQCFIEWFGPTCSVHCRPTARYSCLEDGTKLCAPGWYGPHCDDDQTTSTTVQTSTLNININTFSTSAAYQTSSTEPPNSTTAPKNISFPSMTVTLNPRNSSVRLSQTNVSSNQTSNLPRSNAMFNLPGNNLSVRTVVAISASVGLVVFGASLGAVVYQLWNLKKRRRGQKVGLSPSLSFHGEKSPTINTMTKP
ncbi:hypothetical protein EGW08_009376 [Elysia chlorotica]|uniref:Delta-like protein n=1 Tax=Elysia chlorotica TaxID=188477 RepID=A0A3S0ZN23_ELYCH|nr:hypothetical protein EGW08_009376 [Elysia chlorotica]